MKESDFSTLYVGQVVYFKGESKIITGLEVNLEGDFFVTFDHAYNLSWRNICLGVSLENPDMILKYWLWAVKENGSWKLLDGYYADSGLNPQGELPYGWVNMEKIKHENVFIEV